MGEFRKLEVWRIAHALTLGVYRAASKFPVSERYGLASQLRRAAASIGANLAEGCGRGADTELRRFVKISLGSATELEYHLILAKDLELLSPELYDKLSTDARRVQSMLARLHHALQPVRKGRTTKDQRPETPS